MSRIHANISVFVPHLGCPNKCSFCNQHYIAGKEKEPDEKDIESAVKTAAASKNYDPQSTEIAFFGGSFTAIDRQYMIRLLNTAYRYVKDGTVLGIRISTRPDAVNEEILGILKAYGVTAIELGAQSMSDDVLKLNSRGHSAEDVCIASRLIKENGFSLGLQMMTGLYSSDESTDILTAEKLIELRPDTVRIYPTIVLENTQLYYKYKSGEYIPQTVQSAAELCCKLILMFEQNNIKVIRTGLHTIDLNHYAAGPWHPAFREICDSKIFLKKALDKLSEPGDYIIYVNKRNISKMIGQKRININTLKEKGFNCAVWADESIKNNEIAIKRK